ncbi:hypothetical protein NE237_013566 [Protea cynaroides]|uniref:Uncharacterized protein n=1 Tax=Protea cynaroides TaxID=273540 RepID=A0A9Q0H1Y2_9MAGN|nr:hypothetical protein NE237_013566 [Protea cynaroides]
MGGNGINSSEEHRRRKEKRDARQEAKMAKHEAKKASDTQQAVGKGSAPLLRGWPKEIKVVLLSRRPNTDEIILTDKPSKAPSWKDRFCFVSSPDSRSPLPLCNRWRMVGTKELNMPLKVSAIESATYKALENGTLVSTLEMKEEGSLGSAVSKWYLINSALYSLRYFRGRLDGFDYSSDSSSRRRFKPFVCLAQMSLHPRSWRVGGKKGWERKAPGEGTFAKVDKGSAASALEKRTPLSVSSMIPTMVELDAIVADTVGEDTLSRELVATRDVPARPEDVVQDVSRVEAQTATAAAVWVPLACYTPILV